MENEILNQLKELIQQQKNLIDILMKEVEELRKENNIQEVYKASGPPIFQICQHEFDIIGNCKKCGMKNYTITSDSSSQNNITNFKPYPFGNE